MNGIGNRTFGFILATVIIVMAACQQTENTDSEGSENSTKMQITVKGSDTVLPLTQMEAERMMNKHENVSITVVGGGSGVGISALESNTTDIAMSSRKLKLGERIKLEEADKDFIETIVGFDALAVVVHPKNKVNKLTREQVEDIYTGKIKNWKEVGGPEMEIVVYSRETSSGTYEFFKSDVLNNKNYGSSALMMPATGAIVQSVSQTEGAIGYVGIAYLNDAVKTIEISYDQGSTFVQATYENAKNGSYPVVRPLYYYYLSANKDKVQPFIDYVLSTEGQDIVREVGYVDITE